MTLTEFLLARIADREALAERMLAAVWPQAVYVRPADDTGPQHPVPCVSITDPLHRKEWLRVWKTGNTEIGWTLAPDNVEVWGFTAANAILAECEAKRRIVMAPRPDSGTEFASGVCTALDWTLKILALPDADHPDYPVQAADQTDSTAARNDSSGTAV